MPKTRDKEPVSKKLLIIPTAQLERLQTLMVGRHDSLNAYLRYLIRQEIMRYGPLPGQEKIERKREQEGQPSANV